MLVFAERTGLSSSRPTRRYLWTDAFAVCNFLGLARATGERRHLDLAIGLVEQVHAVLGRHRGDDGRVGWLSGLTDAAARVHPTAGGLRIGKPLRERRDDEPFDEGLEWERDGQYFHYLTRWMHALDQVARATRDGRYNIWARELAAASHAAFVSGAAGPYGRRMFWKMSIDLSRPTVASMGQHDPLEGLVTCAELDLTAEELGAWSAGPSLSGAVADFSAMVARQALTTSDSLGIGGLLSVAGRIAELMGRGILTDGALLDRVAGAAQLGLEQYTAGGESLVAAARRLAFRELGLVIGFEGVRIAADLSRSRVRATTEARLDDLVRQGAFGAALREFWRMPEHRATPIWRAHEDINDVMLATALVPEGYLGAAARGALAQAAPVG